MDATLTDRPAPQPRGTAKPLQVGASKWAQLRGQANLSTRELEQLSGISRGIISLIEGERRLQPTPTEAHAILAALRTRGVTP